MTRREVGRIVIKTLVFLVVIVVMFAIVFLSTNTIKRVPSGGPVGAANDLLPVGTAAPDFALASDEGGTVRLSDFRGQPVVLVFYPGDDTPNCAEQFCAVRDSWAEFTSRGVTVFGINPGSAESHAAFRKHLKLPFRLLVDLDGVAVRAYGARHPVLGITKRTVYGIGPDGRVAFAARGMPKPEDVLAAMEQGAGISERVTGN